MLEYEGSFSLRGDIHTVYDMAETYFPNQGFSLENGQKPNRLVFKKKGTHWTINVRKVPQTLYVTLLTDDKDNITVVMTYVIRITGVWTSGDKRKLDSDIAAFENMLLNSISQSRSLKCFKCGRDNPIDAIYCNYCGEQLDHTRMY